MGEAPRSSSHFIIVFVFNTKIFVIVFFILLFLFFLLFNVFGGTGKDFCCCFVFTYLDTCDQDWPCFLGYTGKYSSKCSDDCYLRHRWPVLVWYACGIWGTFEYCSVCFSKAVFLKALVQFVNCAAIKSHL